LSSHGWPLLGAGCHRRRVAMAFVVGRLLSLSGGNDDVRGGVVVVVVGSQQHRQWDGGCVIDAGHGRCRSTIAGHHRHVGIGCCVVVWSTVLVVASVIVVVCGGAVVVIADGGGRVDNAGGGGGSDALWVG